MSTPIRPEPKPLHHTRIITSGEKSLIMALCIVGGILLFFVVVIVVGIKEKTSNPSCFIYPEPLVLITARPGYNYDVCYNPETEQYITCRPIEQECR